MKADEDRPRLLGYLCAEHPDGPLIPATSYDKPCPKGDKAVWSDGTMTDA